MMSVLRPGPATEMTEVAPWETWKRLQLAKKIGSAKRHMQTLVQTGPSARCRRHQRCIKHVQLGGWVQRCPAGLCLLLESSHKQILR
jgi:hypothetical protein